MGYAIFAQRKLALQGLINSIQLKQTQRSDEQNMLAKKSLSLQNDITNLNYLESSTLAPLYKQLISAGTDAERTSVQAQIKSIETDFENSVNAIQMQQYPIEQKENTIEMEVKRLDTELTSLQKLLEKIEEAEKDGVDKAMPSFTA